MPTKQRRHLQNRFSAAVTSSFLGITLTGIVCGTFASFTYMTRAKIDEFHGVTIGFGNLEAGIMSDADLPNADQYDLVKDESNPNHTIYWFKEHSVKHETLHYVLNANGYATDTLYPVTTRKYASDDEFNLYSAPTILTDNLEPAEKDNYIYLPLVFRYNNIEEDDYLPNEDIYLTDVKINTTDSNSRIHEAVRIFADSKNDNSNLINPSSSSDGTTDVGGILDLNGDGFYDPYYLNGSGYEFVYGQVSEKHYREIPESGDSNSFNPEQRSAFNAEHRAGIYALESCTPEVAQYEGMYDFRNKHKQVTTTNESTFNLAYLDLFIYIEGWDLTVINTEIGIPFSMELKLETDN